MEGKMKKLITGILCVVMSFAFAACSLTPSGLDGPGVPDAAKTKTVIKV